MKLIEVNRLTKSCCIYDLLFSNLAINLNQYFRLFQQISTKKSCLWAIQKNKKSKSYNLHIYSKKKQNKRII